MFILCTAGGAALAVVAYTRLRQRSPAAATAGLRAVSELSAVILVLVKAIEGVVAVLGHQRVEDAPATPNWGLGNYGFDEDDR